MKRADKDHWVIAGLLVFLANCVPPVLFLKTATSIASTVTLVIAIALFFVVYLLTCSRRWWVLPLLGSPIIVWLFLIGLAFVLAVMGIIPVP
jgi:hypothetical protein